MDGKLMLSLMQSAKSSFTFFPPSITKNDLFGELFTKFLLWELAGMHYKEKLKILLSSVSKNMAFLFGVRKNIQLNENNEWTKEIIKLQGC